MGRVIGQSQEQQFQIDHRVLNRAKWSNRALSRLFLHLLVRVFVPGGAPIVVGIDETTERRREANMAAKGISRDPVRSSQAFFVKTSGFRWVSISLGKAGVGCAVSACACPSERYDEPRGRRHQNIHRWRAAHDPPTAALVAWEVSGCRRRQSFCRLRMVGLCGWPPCVSSRDDAFATRCSLL